MLSLCEGIKQKAKEIGFQKVGIVEAASLTDEGSRLNDWLNKGFHGKMAWLAREPDKRSDPRLLFPEARSVIVVLLNYYTDHQHEESTEKGKLSRYAWGDDYHDVVREKLQDLLACIEGQFVQHQGNGQLVPDQKDAGAIGVAAQFISSVPEELLSGQTVEQIVSEQLGLPIVHIFGIARHLKKRDARGGVLEQLRLGGSQESHGCGSHFGSRLAAQNDPQHAVEYVEFLVTRNRLTAAHGQ